MRDHVEKRLAELKSELELGQKQLGALESRAQELKTTIYRISGAIQVLEEVLAEDARPHALPRPATGS